MAPTAVAAGRSLRRAATATVASTKARSRATRGTDRIVMSNSMTYKFIDELSTRMDGPNDQGINADATTIAHDLKCGKVAREMDVKIDVEYCGSCGHKKQFLQLAEEIKKNVPNATIAGTAGRQASFEVQVNEELVYSKLRTLAFPDFAAIADVIKDVSTGKPVRKVDQQQPMDCVLM